MTVKKYVSGLVSNVRYCAFKILPERMYPFLIKTVAKLHLHESIDFDNPKTINDKLHWLKLYDKNPMKSVLADKYSVREYVSERIGEDYLIPLLGVWDSFDDIDFLTLPNRFVLKATHGCGCNIIIKDKEKVDYRFIQKSFKKWFSINYAYYSGELQYKSIRPRIIAEEYLENAGGELFDYKVFCFNGKARYIMFLNDRHTSLKMAFYDTNWQKQPFTYSYPQIEEDIDKPECLEELIEKAECLAKGFDLVRVDFYILNNGSIKFGEMTFASAGGLCKWYPKEYNMILGQQIDLTVKNK